MNKKIFTSLIVISVYAAVSAWGAESVKTGDGKPVDSISLGKSISFDELKERCVHPEQFDVQKSPQNMKIQCTENRFRWVAAAPGEMSFPVKRSIVSGIFADKFFVNAEQAEMPMTARSGSCFRFKEIAETATIERPLSCADLLSIKGSLAEFCSSIVTGAKGSNPKVVESQETGRLIDTCSVGIQVQGNPKGAK